MINQTLARQVLQYLASQGVREICLCPGARNAPFLVSLTSTLAESQSSFQVYYFFDERSASFFALGRIRRTGKPVVVLTTSGTAVGELLPATMEAYYSGLPLVLLTADRPRRYRGSGAPQCAEQVGIFGVYVGGSLDLSVFETAQTWERVALSRNRPFHINVCFDEPLLDESDRSRVSRVPRVSVDLTEFLRKVKRPLVIVGMLQPSEREKVAELLLCWKCPTYFEAPSGLREDARFRDFRVRVSHRIRQRAVQSDYPIDGVIRIGGVPTLRFWRDLDLDDAELPVLNMSEIPFSGLGRPSIQLSLSHFCRFDFCEHYKEDFPKNFFEQDRKAQAELERLLECEPQSEPGMVAKLSCLIPQRAQIFLGNSLPIREWDLAATSQDRGYQIWASRGLNGIDGQISTFLGLAEPGLSHWAILGDLTTLYDLSGPWILSQWGGGVPSKLDVNLVVINNGGGKIFSQMFSQSEFQNPHSLCFKSWANFWGLEYELWHQIPTSSEKTGERPRVIELRPDEKATQRFWKEASRE